MSTDQSTTMQSPSDKTCNRCGETKPITEFYLRYTLPGRRDHTCKECRKLGFRQADAKRKAEISELRRQANEMHNV